MTYGKTLPFELVCQNCKSKSYGQRLNRSTQEKWKKEGIVKFCNHSKCNSKQLHKAKECKHSSN